MGNSHRHHSLGRYPPLAAALAVAATLGCSGSSSAGRAEAEPASSAASTSVAESDPLVQRADSARIAGNPNASVWLIVVSDFQCPYCKIWHDNTLPAVKAEYVNTGKVRLAYVNFPLGQHPHAIPAAEAAMCAGAQGKFWEYADSLFTTQNEWSPLENAGPVLARLAARVGLDTSAWSDCINRHVMRPLIESDRERSLQAGVNSTPTLIAGNHRLAGAAPIGDMRRMLDSALAEAARSR
jgi:protein-disulfide isomerase